MPLTAFVAALALFSQLVPPMGAGICSLTGTSPCASNFGSISIPVQNLEDLLNYQSNQKNQSWTPSTINRMANDGNNLTEFHMYQYDYEVNFFGSRTGDSIIGRDIVTQFTDSNFQNFSYDFYDSMRRDEHSTSSYNKRDNPFPLLSVPPDPFNMVPNVQTMCAKNDVPPFTPVQIYHREVDSMKEWGTTFGGVMSLVGAPTVLVVPKGRLNCYLQGQRPLGMDAVLSITKQISGWTLPERIPIGIYKGKGQKEYILVTPSDTAIIHLLGLSFNLAKERKACKAQWKFENKTIYSSGGEEWLDLLQFPFEFSLSILGLLFHLIEGSIHLMHNICYLTITWMFSYFTSKNGIFAIKILVAFIRHGKIKITMHHYYRNLLNHLYVALLCSLITPCDAVDQNNQPKDWNILHGIKIWDGLPSHDFRRFWWLHLVVALGAIVQNGNTLLQTARGEDAGRDGTTPVVAVAAPNEAPNAVAARQARNDEKHAEEAQAHQVRVIRLAACIMNYINPKAAIFQVLSRAPFQNQGVAIYNYIFEQGHIPRDHAATQVLLQEWEEATMARVNIKFDEQAVFNWLEWCKDKAQVLNKGNRQIRKKFLDGFPESFDNVISPERMRGDDGSYLIAANFPAHHPHAGQANPQAGQPDVDAMARAFFPEWARRVHAGRIKIVPRGMAHSTHPEPPDSESDEETNFVNRVTAMAVSKSKITADFICTICGGRGHAGNVDGTECLTKQLGLKIPIEELKSTVYPNGLSFPSFNNFFSRRKATKEVKSRKKFVPRRPPRNAKAVENEPEREEPEIEDTSGSDVDESIHAVKMAGVKYDHQLQSTTSKYQSFSDSD